MRSIIIAVTIIAAVGIVSAFAVSELTEQAGAAPPPPQAREDQITLLATGEHEISSGPGLEYAPLNANVPLLLALNPADYPPSTTFRLELVFVVPSGTSNTHCFRLFDTTGGTVPAETCYTRAAQLEHVRTRSAPFNIEPGERVYTLQAKSDMTTGGETWFVIAARIIAEWTERR